MAGDFDLYDRVDLAPFSESVPRQRSTTTCQIHHAAGTSDLAVHDAMEQGGRTLSATAILERDGTLVQKVPHNRKPHTSGSVTGFDHESFTVEVVNQSGHPTWGISEAQRARLGRWARDLARLGLIRGVHRGVGGIIGHSETPGAYPTACPGPDMHLDHVAELAAADEPTPTTKPKDSEMPIAVLANGHVFTLSPGRIVHQADGGQADFVRDTVNGEPEWVKTDLNGLVALLDAFDVPRDVVSGTSGEVLDPLDGKRKRGGQWSYDRAILAATRALATPPTA